MVQRADALPESAWEPLRCRPKARGRRRGGERVKEKIVADKEYRKLRLESEHVAEWEHRPVKCGKPYRLVVLCKRISVERGQKRFFDETRYFFYITNLSAQEVSASQVVADHSG